MSGINPPTVAQLIADPIVQGAPNQAWIDSMPSDPVARHEGGGGIYLNLKSGEFAIQRATPGSEDSIDLGNPPTFSGRVVVATFHTHPNPSGEGWKPGPSADDDKWARASGVRWLIKADDGIHNTGPSHRPGGLKGDPGCPA